MSQFIKRSVLFAVGIAIWLAAGVATPAHASDAYKPRPVVKKQAPGYEDDHGFHGGDSGAYKSHKYDGKSGKYADPKSAKKYNAKPAPKGKGYPAKKSGPGYNGKQAPKQHHDGFHD